MAKLARNRDIVAVHVSAVKTDLEFRPVLSTIVRRWSLPRLALTEPFDVRAVGSHQEVVGVHRRDGVAQAAGDRGSAKVSEGVVIKYAWLGDHHYAERAVSGGQHRRVD